MRIGVVVEEGQGGVPMRPGKCLAIALQFPSPYSSTSLRSGRKLSIQQWHLRLKVFWYDSGLMSLTFRQV